MPVHCRTLLYQVVYYSYTVSQVLDRKNYIVICTLFVCGTWDRGHLHSHRSPRSPQAWFQPGIHKLRLGIPTWRWKTPAQSRSPSLPVTRYWSLHGAPDQPEIDSSVNQDSAMRSPVVRLLSIWPYRRNCPPVKRKLHTGTQ